MKINPHVFGISDDDYIVIADPQPHDPASASERPQPVNLHRTFVCGTCGRQIAGCNCPTAELEVIDSCAVCNRPAHNRV